MTIHIPNLIPILSIAAGIAVLVVPRSTKFYVIGGYLIAVGVIQLIQ